MRDAWVALGRGMALLFALGMALPGCGGKPEVETVTEIGRHAATLVSERGDTGWDLVALGDSTPAGLGVGADESYVQVYARFVEEDLGVSVSVHNHATGGLRTVADWAQLVAEDEALREELRQAEVITLWLGSHDVLRAVGVGRGGPCYPREGAADLDCLRQMSDAMQEGYERLLSEIAALASPRETLILIADIGIAPPLLSAWKEDGSFDLLKQHAYEVWRGHLIEAASAHGVLVVPTYAFLNGPRGDRETPSRYLQADGVHLNAEGHREIALIHRRVGYHYLAP